MEVDISEANKCIRAIDPNNFLAGMYEKVRPCKYLKHLLCIERTEITVATIFGIIQGNFNYKQEMVIPLPILPHFLPHTKVTPDNVLEVMAKHVRFVAAKLKYLFINNIDLRCTIRIFDMSEEDQVPEIDYVDLEPVQDTHCTSCGRYFQQEEFFNHFAKGPFAKFHSLYAEVDLEVKALLALNVFKFFNHTASCKYCKMKYSMLHHHGVITQHAVLHAAHFLPSNINLMDAKTTLWNKVKRNNETLAHFCMKCNRWFSNIWLFYLHINLFDHDGFGKNICVKCKIVYRESPNEHINEYHKEDQRCPHFCPIKGSLLVHHMEREHNSNTENVPNIEAEQLLKRIKGNPNLDRIIGTKGQIKFDRRFRLEIESLCRTATVGMNNVLRYTMIDPLGWRIAEKVIEARMKNLKYRQDLVQILEENPMRIIPKVILHNQMATNTYRSLDSEYVIFDSRIVANNMYSVSHEHQHFYSKDLLDTTNVIVLGNNNYVNLGSTRELKIFNLSTVRPSMWDFDGLGHGRPNTNFTYNRHVLTEVSRIQDKDKTIILEASLAPLLSKLDENERLKFLQDNVETLAKGYLKLAAEVQSLMPNIAVSTCLHVNKSVNMAEENIQIMKFNEIIKVGALQLHVGIIDIANIGFITSHLGEESRHICMSPLVNSHILDLEGKFTKHGQDCVTSLITEFETERMIMKSQIEGCNLKLTTEMME